MDNFVCRNCESDNLELVLDLGLQPWGNHFAPISPDVAIPRYPLELYVCKTCWMTQIGHTVPKEIMFVDHGYITGTTRSIRAHFREVADEIVARSDFGQEDYVLDIGGNDGTFLEQVKRHDIGVLNVDSGTLQAKRSQEVGVPCLNLFFNEHSAQEILKEYGPARVIHGANVLFHLEELHSVFSGIKTLLAPDGQLCAEFVYLPIILKNATFDQVYHEHLLYYTLHSFQNLLARHGMKLTDVRLAPIHGGSCIVTATHVESTEPASQSVLDMLEEERRLGVEKMDIYLDFPRQVQAIKDSLLAIVDEQKAGGCSIQALGAPVKGSTIINYCGLDVDRIDCAVEVNRFKVGTYVPGTRIPVQFQDDTPAPDVYLMLAWNFKNELLEKLTAFREQGGRFIVPFPSPHII